MLKNIINNNLKNILRMIKFTKTRSGAVSIWSITFERLKIKISAFRRFVARQLMILVHSWNFKICCIFIGQQTNLSIWPWIANYLSNKFQQFYMNRCAVSASFQQWKLQLSILFLSKVIQKIPTRLFPSTERRVLWKKIVCLFVCLSSGQRSKVKKTKFRKILFHIHNQVH